MRQTVAKANLAMDDSRLLVPLLLTPLRRPVMVVAVAKAANDPEGSAYLLPSIPFPSLKNIYFFYCVTFKHM